MNTDYVCYCLDASSLLIAANNVNDAVPAADTVSPSSVDAKSADDKDAPLSAGKLRLRVLSTVDDKSAADVNQTSLIDSPVTLGDVVLETLPPHLTFPTCMK